MVPETLTLDKNTHPKCDPLPTLLTTKDKRRNYLAFCSTWENFLKPWSQVSDAWTTRLNMSRHYFLVFPYMIYPWYLSL